MTASDESDHVARLMALRQRETPDVPLDGMAILARARRLDRLSRTPIEAVFASHGVSTGEFDLLATLQRVGPPYEMRPTELYESLMITSGGVTNRLRGLRRRGLVEDAPATADRRSLPVRLSELGLEVIRLAFKEDMEVELEILSGLDEVERAALARLLSKLLLDIERREW